MGDHLRALRWDAATLSAERERRLRQLVAHARERSPGHARRLREVGVVGGLVDITGLCDEVPGSGLTNMRARAELLGGHFAVRDRPNGGLELTWAVPRDRP